MSRILITGSSNGLGAALVAALRKEKHEIVYFDHSHGNDIRDPISTFGPPPMIDVLINCAGVNDIDMLEDFDEARYDEVMGVNAKGIYMMSRWLLPSLIATKGTIVNIVSNASHVPMTGSLAYNMSKGAAAIATLQLARELSKRHDITVFGISPNKLASTNMSKKIESDVLRVRGWTAEEARRYQLAALPAKAETPPEAVAEFVAFLLDSKERHRYLTGCILPYGA